MIAATLLLSVFALPQVVVLEARVVGGDELSDALHEKLDQLTEQPATDKMADRLAVLAAEERALVVRRDQPPVLLFPSVAARTAGWPKLAPRVAERIGGHLVLVICPPGPPDPANLPPPWQPPILHLAVLDAEGALHGERDVSATEFELSASQLIEDAGGGTNALLVDGPGKAALRVELDPPSRTLDVSLVDDDGEPSDWLCGTPCTLHLDPGDVRLRIGSGLHAEAIRNITLPPTGARVLFHVFPEWVHVTRTLLIDAGVVGLSVSVLAALLYKGGAIDGSDNGDGTTSTPRYVGYTALVSLGVITVGVILWAATRTHAHLLPAKF